MAASSSLVGVSVGFAGIVECCLCMIVLLGLCLHSMLQNLSKKARSSSLSHDCLCSWYNVLIPRLLTAMVSVPDSLLCQLETRVLLTYHFGCAALAVSGVEILPVTAQVLANRFLKWDRMVLVVRLCHLFIVELTVITC